MIQLAGFSSEKDGESNSGGDPLPVLYPIYLSWCWITDTLTLDLRLSFFLNR